MSTAFKAHMITLMWLPWFWVKHNLYYQKKNKLRWDFGEDATWGTKKVVPLLMKCFITHESQIACSTRHAEL